MEYKKLTINFILFLVSIFSAQAQSVKLYGTSQDSTIRKASIIVSSPFWQEMVPPTKLAVGERKADNSISLELDLDAPAVVTFSILGVSEVIYVQPSDSINFTIVREGGRPKISFTGENKAYYNYGMLLNDFLEENGSIYPYFPRMKDILQYKAAVDERYRLRKEFLSLYRQQNKLTDDFIDYALSETQSEYIKFIYKPLTDAQVKQEDLPKDYFFQSNAISLREAGLAHQTHNIMQALAHKYIIHSTSSPWDSFDASYNTIRENYSGRTRELLITSLIGVYSKKQLQQYHTSLIKAFHEIPEYVQDKECLSYITRSERQYTMLDQPFPKEVLTETFLTAYGSNTKVTLAQLLEQYKGEAIYIDFWASWCSACRVDIADAKDAKKYMEEKKVRIIYISLDTEQNTERWKKASVKDGITEDQYLMAGDFSAPLAKHLKIQSLPQYIILNPAHDVKNVEAPRPTSSQLAKLKMSVADALGQTKRFY